MKRLIAMIAGGILIAGASGCSSFNQASSGGGDYEPSGDDVIETPEGPMTVTQWEDYLRKQ